MDARSLEGALNLDPGGFFSWGQDAYRQLGLTKRDGPSSPDGCLPEPRLCRRLLGAAVVKVSLGSSFTAALTAAGELFIFGADHFGQCGSGGRKSGRSSATHVVRRPVRVRIPRGKVPRRAHTAASGVRSSPSTDDHGPAGDEPLKRGAPGGGDGGGDAPGVRSGDDEEARLMRELALRSWSDVACGANHVVAVSAGRVATWGFDSRNQLGREGNPRRPTWIGGLPDADEDPVVSVAAGNEHSAALTRSGACYTWGRGTEGQLGYGIGRDFSLPRRVFFANPALAAADDEDAGDAAGGGRTAAAAAAAIAAAAAERAAGISDVAIASIACGAEFTSAVTRDGGELYLWGNNSDGQLGLGSNANELAPRLVAVGVRSDDDACVERVAKVVCGWRHAGCITVSGNVYVWGANESGQLGLGDIVNRWLPTLLCGGPAWSAREESRVDAAPTVNGTPRTFKVRRRAPVPIEHNPLLAGPFAVQNVEDLAMGSDFSLVISSLRHVYAMGSNRYGKLGIGHWGLPASPTETSTSGAAPGDRDGDRDGDGDGDGDGRGEKEVASPRGRSTSAALAADRVLVPSVVIDQVRVKQVACGGEHAVAVPEHSLDDSLALDLRELFESGVGADVTFEFDDAPPVYAHSFVLRARCPRLVSFFSTALAGPAKPSDPGEADAPSPPASHHAPATLSSRDGAACAASTIIITEVEPCPPEGPLRGTSRAISHHDHSSADEDAAVLSALAATATATNTAGPMSSPSALDRFVADAFVSSGSNGSGKDGKDSAVDGDKGEGQGAATAVDTAVADDDGASGNGDGEDGGGEEEEEDDDDDEEDDDDGNPAHTLHSTGSVRLSRGSSSRHRSGGGASLSAVSAGPGQNLTPPGSLGRSAVSDGAISAGSRGDRAAAGEIFSSVRGVILRPVSEHPTSTASGSGGDMGHDESPLHSRRGSTTAAGSEAGADGSTVLMARYAAYVPGVSADVFTLLLQFLYMDFVYPIEQDEALALLDFLDAFAFPVMPRLTALCRRAFAEENDPFIPLPATTLRRDLGALLDRLTEDEDAAEALTDTVFVLEDGSLACAHAALLFARCGIEFCAHFDISPSARGRADGVTEMIGVPKTIPASVFRALLRHAYTGSFDAFPPDRWIEAFDAANRFHLSSITAHCASRLWASVDNLSALPVLRVARLHREPALATYCLFVLNQSWTTLEAAAFPGFTNPERDALEAFRFGFKFSRGEDGGAKDGHTGPDGGGGGGGGGGSLRDRAESLKGKITSFFSRRRSRSKASQDGE